MSKTAVLFVSAAVLLSLGCKNKDYENCLHQADEYDKGKLECLKITDKAQQEACTSKSEVKKITKDDCDKSYK